MSGRAHVYELTAIGRGGRVPGEGVRGLAVNAKSYFLLVDPERIAGIYDPVTHRRPVANSVPERIPAGHGYFSNQKRVGKPRGNHPGPD